MPAAFLPAGQELVQCRLPGRGQPACTVFDPLAMEPHAQCPFVDVVRLLVPGPVSSGGPEVPQFQQPALPARFVIGFASGGHVPAGNEGQGFRLGGGEGSLFGFPAPAAQPYTQGPFLGGGAVAGGQPAS